ncbi:hypothetical protein ACFFUB_00475 [Algimonas porphyrae]|uniref:Uncharacterized protein n=1 Tax=Algimonas porphyrae TaxID=1128113 RepID=A0ABQ5UYY0_9PROT|nr:hypothetical protein [Algimonas porphyrae]GLQ20505.1 hypothetical protein GCM10007854_14600 [Algimonas porphyrae]
MSQNQTEQSNQRKERFVAVAGPINVAGALRRFGDSVFLTDREAASYGAMISDRKPAKESLKTGLKSKDAGAD